MTGAFTYYNRQGCSVIDYLLLKERDFNSVSNFRVEHFNEFSDHAPLTFTIECIQPACINTYRGETVYRWREKFTGQLSQWHNQ